MVLRKSTLKTLCHLQWLPMTTEVVHFGSVIVACGGLISSKRNPPLWVTTKAGIAGALPLTGC